MKILVHPHHMEVGGSQLNAIELADAVHKLGHEVVLYAPPGVLVEEVRRRGLELILAPAERRLVPSPTSVGRLRGLVRQRGFDVVHSYEWNATLDALYGPAWSMNTPVLSTVLSMVVPSHLPVSVPLVVGTKQLYEQERTRRAKTYLLEPPIDTALNRPGVAPIVNEGPRSTTVRERWDIPPDEKLVVLVGRLSPGLKIGGVLEAIRAMALVPDSHKAHLLIVGDGPERARVDVLASQVNARRRAITIAGQMMDPRPAYDAADIVLGMGGSILRGMAFGKPAIVQGERGFWKILDSESVHLFRHQGWYGIGNGTDGAPLLTSLLDTLLSNPEAADRNARLGRELVSAEYSLDHLATKLVGIYATLVGNRAPASSRIHDSLMTTYWLARTEVSGAVRRAERRIREALPGDFGDRFVQRQQEGPSWS
jgi:glycosyltransferase involved in cell wall biosynthesis